MKFEEIAAFTLGDTTVPQSSLEMASTLLIDTLGVAAGAADIEAGRLARQHAFQFHAAADPSQAATLLFDGRKASLPGATFALASQIDNLDAHDGYNPTKGHIGCAVVPALCAFAEQMPELSAHEALAILAVSYEVSARAGIALHASVSDYHTSGAWNALGVVALAGRLRRVDSETLRQAFGIAEYHGPRSQMMREIANPTMLHDGSGMGAMVGSMAILMAEQGFEGAPALTVEAEGAAPYWDDLGTFWTIEQNYIKPYPICRWAHAAIDALGQVIEARKLHCKDIARIEVQTFAQAASLFPGMPQSTSQAQYSLGFALAVRLVHGRIGPEHITGAGLRDPEVAKALDRIIIHEAAHHSERFPTSRFSDVTVHLNDGTVVASGDVHARGGPEAPMALDEVEAKFLAMSASLPSSRSRALWAMRQRLLEPDTKFTELLTLIHPAVEGQHV